MFLAHFAAGLAAKRLSPRTPLAVLFIAGQLTDLLWPLFLLAGLERARVDPGNTAVTPLEFVSYPYSHSLLFDLFWAAAFGMFVAAVQREGRAFWVAGACVLSHWVLDAVSHRPDMPLAPGVDTRIGLGLWQSVPATLAVEASLFLGGIALYLKGTRPLDRVGSWGFALFFATLAAVYLSSVFGPPPPSITVVAISANALWLFMLWAWRLERHRAPA